MNLKPLVSRIEAGLLGKQGKDLFIRMMPADVTSGILLRGPLAGMKIDHELPGFYKGPFTLIVRSETYEEGLALIEKVTDLITLIETQVGTQYFNYCRPKSLPVPFPLSKGNLVEHTVAFEVCYVEQ